MSDTPPDSPPRLMGWKDIGAYLNKSARTVQRWEQELGLPVHRIRTEQEGQIIYAERQEIDEWLTRRSAAAPGGDDATVVEAANPIDGSPPGAEIATPVAAPRGSWRWVSPAAATVIVAIVAAGWLTYRSETSDLLPGLTGLDQPAIYLIASSGVMVYDEASGTVVRGIGLPDRAPFADLHGGTLASHAPELVFATRGPAGAVSLDLRTERWLPWTPLHGQRMTGSAITADGQLQLALDQDGRAVISDTRTRLVLGAVLVPVHAFDVVAFGDRHHFLVTGRDDGVISVVDGDARQVASQIRGGASVGHMAITADAKRLFVTNHYQDTLSCLDLSNEGAAITTPVGVAPWNLVLTPDERTVYVADRDSDSVSVVDASTCRTVTTITNVFERGQIGPITVGSGGRRLYVANMRDSRMAVFDVSGEPGNPTRLTDVALPRPISNMVASPAARR